MKSLKYRTANGIRVYTNSHATGAGLIGSQAHAWESIFGGSASIVPNEAEPLNLCYQAGAW